MEIQCENCKEWGNTVTRETCYYPIPCPKCKRLTYPNLGVNLPAGCSVALSTAIGVKCIRSIQSK